MSQGKTDAGKHHSRRPFEKPHSGSRGPQGARPHLAPVVVENPHPRRTKVLQALVQARFQGDVIEFAAASHLNPLKVRGLLNGDPLPDELAFHIKEVLGLKAQWADTGDIEKAPQDEEYPESTGVNEPSVLRDESSAASSTESQILPTIKEPQGSAVVQPPQVAAVLAVSEGPEPTLVSESVSMEQAMNQTDVNPTVTVKKTRSVSKKPVIDPSGDTEDILATRQANLGRLTSWHGSKKRLAAMLGEQDQLMVTYLLSGRKKFWSNFASAIEASIGLEPGWLSTPDAQVPDQVVSAIKAADPETPAPQKAFNITPRKYTRNTQAKAKAAPAAPAAPAAVAPVTAPAKPAAAPAPAPAPRAAANEASAPVSRPTAVPSPVAEAVKKLTTAAQAQAPAAAQTLSLPVAPGSIAGFVVTTLAQRLAENTLSDQTAYRILGLLVEDR